jgi:pimeloyl-ACP methyl ester carboxylesterase
LGEQFLQVQQLVLLAPAFQFLSHWQSRLGNNQIQQWQSQGAMPIYHYGDQQMRPLDYRFINDLSQYEEATLQRPVPTLILHGRQDEVIPIQASRDYAASRSWVELIELEGDHGLINVQAEIWQAIQSVCQLT